MTDERSHRERIRDIIEEDRDILDELAAIDDVIEDETPVPVEEAFPIVTGSAEASTRGCGGFFEGGVDIETWTVSVEEPHDSSDAIFLDVWGEYGECSATMDIYLSEEEAHKLAIHLLTKLLSLKQDGDSSE